MKLICYCVITSLLVGCAKESPSVSPPAVQPNVPKAPVAATPKLRPRFREGLEAFITEVRVLTNLPSTGASFVDMQEQLSKVQQAIARLPDAQGNEETFLSENAKVLTTRAIVLLEYYRMYATSQEYPDLAKSTKTDVDKNVADIKAMLLEIEDEVDKSNG